MIILPYTTPEEKGEQIKQWREQNKQHLKNQLKLHYEQHKDKLNKRNIQYYEQHKRKLKEYRKRKSHVLFVIN